MWRRRLNFQAADSNGGASNQIAVRQSGRPVDEEGAEDGAGAVDVTDLGLAVPGPEVRGSERHPMQDRIKL
jgi:hypothetical protein